MHAERHAPERRWLPVVLTVSAGVALAHRLPEKPMRTAFAAMLVGTAAWLIVGPMWMA